MRIQPTTHPMCSSAGIGGGASGKIWGMAQAKMTRMMPMTTIGLPFERNADPTMYPAGGQDKQGARTTEYFQADTSPYTLSALWFFTDHRGRRHYH